MKLSSANLKRMVGTVLAYFRGIVPPRSQIFMCPAPLLFFKTFRCFSFAIS